MTMSRRLKPRCQESSCPARGRYGQRLYVRAIDNRGYVPAGWVCRGGHTLKVDLPQEIAWHDGHMNRGGTADLSPLERRFLNAQRFFWGVFQTPLFHGNQSDTYRRLENKYRLQFRRERYHDVAEELVATYGGNKIRDIAVQEANDGLGQELISLLRSHWQRGEWPVDFAALGPYSHIRDFAGILDIDVYYDRNQQHLVHTIRGWGEFAPVLFDPSS